MTSIDTSRDVPGCALAPRTSALALVVICTGYCLVILDAMVVNVALPSIGQELHGGVTGLQWDVAACTLSFAGLLLTAGTMAERLGARPVFLGGVAAFALASAACGLAPSLGVLVAARAVQGIGGVLASTWSWRGVVLHQPARGRAADRAGAAAGGRPARGRVHGVRADHGADQAGRDGRRDGRRATGPGRHRVGRLHRSPAVRRLDHGAANAATPADQV